MIHSKSVICKEGSLCYLLPISGNTPILIRRKSLSDISPLLMRKLVDSPVINAANSNHSAVDTTKVMKSVSAPALSTVKSPICSCKTFQDVPAAVSVVKKTNAFLPGKPQSRMISTIPQETAVSVPSTTASYCSPFSTSFPKISVAHSPLSSTAAGLQISATCSLQSSAMTNSQSFTADSSLLTSTIKPLAVASHATAIYNPQACTVLNPPVSTVATPLSLTIVNTEIPIKTNPQAFTANNSLVVNSQVSAAVTSHLPVVTNPQAVLLKAGPQIQKTTAKQCSHSSQIKPRTHKVKEEVPHSITKVASLVFFDLETTGLAFEIGKSNVQITEISMISICRREFEQCKSVNLSDIRITQKLCLCTKPRSLISSGAAAVTGLNETNLADQKPFDQTAAEMIISFLSRLPKPVCLIAHNGNHFDFPLLKAEFSRLSMTLPLDILIADSLCAFRVFGVPVYPPEKNVCSLVKYTKSGRLSYSLENLYLYFFSKNPVGSHSSEGDCIALAKICHEMKDLMLPWIDENCTPFESVTPMW